LGGEPEVRGTFFITDAFIECETCVAACPEQCIASGSPYKIEQSHCLRCGICQEACPVQAIVKR
jgi:Pyruvate/2-oxoacid:ferredoxin oxidoreductase delta subunit